MTVYGIIFYLLAAVIVIATCLAITRANLIHTVVYLVISFFGSAMVFYLLGAPFLAVLEVIIYAGAIMVLFLFIIMMLKIDVEAESRFHLPQLLPAGGLALMYLVVVVLLIFSDPASLVSLRTAMATPTELGRFVFQRYWLAVEIVSLLLLIALVAVVHLGKTKKQASVPEIEDEK